MTPIFHRACRGIAFHYDGCPVVGEVIDPARARLPDGSTPIPGSPMICGACGQQIENPGTDLTAVGLPDPW